MTSILFVGGFNTCRSPAAELILKDLAEKTGLDTQFHIESAGVNAKGEESMLTESTRGILDKLGIDYSGKTVRQMHKEDYHAFEFLIAMDWASFSRARAICGGDPENKIHFLLDFTEQPGEVENPEFSEDYLKTWIEISTGCAGLLDYLKRAGKKPGKSRRILCFGDSNTYGFDPRSLREEPRYGESVRWTELLRQKGWRILNEGQNGRAIPYRKTEIENACARFREHHADAAVIMLGTNDLLKGGGLTAEVCAKRMETFLSDLLSERPPFVLLLTAPPAMLPGAWIDSARILDESRRLSGCYRTLAQKTGIAFADAASWNVALTFDGVHFSKSGHRTFAAEMHKTLCSVFTQ